MPDREPPVERLKSKLYSRTQAPTVEPTARSPLSSSRKEAPRSWDGMKEEGALEKPVAPLTLMEKRTSKHTAAWYFLWGSFIFFVIAAAVAGWALWGGLNTISPQNIDVQIVAPSLIDSGKGATLQYIIQNRNNTSLLAADLVVTYPDGTRSQNDPTVALPNERISLGTIAPGQQIKQTSSALFFGASGSQEKVSVTLEYQLAGSNSVFVKQVDTMFTIGSSPISVSISSPTEAISGQPFSLDVEVSSNATSPLQNVAVEVQYPFGFAVNSVSPAAAPGNTLWHLGTLNPGGSQTIHISGVLTGEDGDERVFHFLAGTESDPTETSLAVPLLSTPQTVTVRKPFIGATISLDGNTGATIAEPLGGTISGNIAWQNNLTETVSNVTFTLSLSGSAIDGSSVRAINGFYDSNKQQITWSGDQNSQLASVAPGAGGSFQFSLATLPPGSAPLANPEATLNLTVHGTRQGTGVPEDITTVASTKIELASAVSASAQALHFTGPFSESGSLPPRVGQTTTYAIVFSVKNSSNTLGGATMSTVLPPYVSFIGAGTAGGEQVSYDDSTRTVTWTLGDVEAGVGYSTPARQASFQVSLTPSLSQVGSAPALTGAIQFQGQDRFAQAQVTASADPLTTLLSSDPGFSRGMEIVGQ